MKEIKKFLNDKKGAFSILFVILAFIGVLIMTWAVDVLKESYVISEVQGIMDVAGVSALNASVDKEALRGEEFKYDKDTLITTYHDIINQRIKTGDVISYKRLMKTEVRHDVSSQGLGNGSKPSDQLWLDSVMMLRVKTSQVFDLVPSLQRQFYDSKSSGSFTITVSGQTEDGQTELIIRSVTRLVYR
jgi:hypothetical protein